MSGVVVRRLRNAGFDVATLSRTARGVDDDVVLAMAEAGNRILITEDRDFGELVIRQRLPVLGVLLLELDRLSNDAEADRVLDVLTSEGDKLEGNLVVVEPSRTRFRPLPRRQ